MSIAELSIKRPIFIVMIILSIITLGLIGYSKLPVDLLPSIDFPTIVVVTDYPGASSTEIETLITKPLENALANVEGLDTLSSNSREGTSMVSVSFKMGVDVKFAELKVREKVQKAMSQLPDDAKDPVINRFSTDDMPIMFLSIQGKRSLSDLREMLDNDVRPKIESIEGVGSISILGAQKLIVKITVDNSLLAAGGISHSQVISAIKKKNTSFPLGEIKTAGKNITVRVYGKAESVKDIGNITLTSSSGKIFRVSDIAKVEMVPDDEDTRARVKQDNAVMFRLYKQSGSNTVEVAKSLRDELVNIEKLLPPDVKIRVVSDSSVAINRSISGVQNDIMFGAFLAILIVWLFLGNFRSTIITAVALPNSLLGAFFLINQAGYSINTMTLLALSLSVGLLIDDSIVVRENIFRYIENGHDPKSAAIKGTNEVALAVLSTTLSIMAVFIPISFLEGVIGQFFKEFGFTVAFALGISLVDAFTSAPMLSAYWFKHTVREKAGGFRYLLLTLSDRWNEFYKKINSFYHRLLGWCLDHKVFVIIPVVLLFVVSLYASKFIGKNFISNSDSGSINIDLETYPGAPIDIIDGYLKKIEVFLTKQKDVDAFYTIVGDNGNSNSGSINVDLLQVKERKISTQDMIFIIRQYIRKNFDKDLIVRISERSSIGGGGMGFGGGFGGGAIQINLTGTDLKILENLSRKVYNLVIETPGTSDVNSSFKPGNPEMIVKLDPVKAEKTGVNENDLGTTMRDLIQGTTVSTFTQNDREYDIVLRLDNDEKDNIEEIKNMTIPSQSGSKMPLASIADFSYASAPINIRRENKQRIVRITSNLEKGYSLSEVVSKIKTNIDKKIIMPNGYTYYFGGQQKQFADLASQIMFAFVIALIFMYMILASLYNSFIQPLILMASIPLAIIGSYLGLLITNVDLDIYGYIGLILVLGLVVKNGILLIDFTNKKREDGLTIRDSLLTASPIRLRPILMTSFAMVFGMLPLALGLNEGSRGRQALPITVIGGIITSTFLTLVVIPVLYEWIEVRLEKKKAASSPIDSLEPVKQNDDFELLEIKNKIRQKRKGK